MVAKITSLDSYLAFVSFSQRFLITEKRPGNRRGANLPVLSHPGPAWVRESLNLSRHVRFFPANHCAAFLARPLARDTGRALQMKSEFLPLARYSNKCCHGQDAGHRFHVRSHSLANARAHEYAYSKHCAPYSLHELLKHQDISFNEIHIYADIFLHK